MSGINNISNFKNEITEKLKQILIEGAKPLFEQNKDLYSFGWNHYKHGDSWGSHLRYSSSKECPDICGAIGAKLYLSTNLYPLQCKVKEFLDTFDDNIFISCFGDNAEIAVYRDNTIEITTHDNNRSIPVELSEA